MATIRRSIYLLIVLVIALLTFKFYSTEPSISNTIKTTNKKSTNKINHFNSNSSTFTTRLVAIADLHGDLDHTKRVMQLAGLIDNDYNWIGEKTILVQTGDIVDRGTDTIALYKLMDSLRTQASNAGGSLYSLLGNHEIMNYIGDLRYVTPDDVNTFPGGLKGRTESMLSGWIGQTWRTNYSITARVPYSIQFQSLPRSLQSIAPAASQEQHFFSDFTSPEVLNDPFLNTAASFVHGGITPKYLKSLNNSNSPISEINSIGRSIMLKVLEESTSTSTRNYGLPRSSSKEEIYFWSAEGPMWDRTYALDENEAEVCALAAEACKMLKVRRLIMGHTPNFEGIVSRCDGQILLIDTGISRAYGGTLSALEILYTLTPSTDLSLTESTANIQIPDALKGVKNVWFEREVVSALYEDRRVELSKAERFIELPEE